jgi:hypothetical protein
MRFRLKEVEGVGWFAQVNPEATFLEEKLFDKWYTIDGKDFLPETDVSSPQPNKAQAERALKEFKLDVEPNYSEPKVSYHEV